MQHHGVPDVLQRKVAKWLEYSWVRTQGADEQGLMDALPERLRARIAIQIHVKTLKKVGTFTIYISLCIVWISWLILH